MKKIFTPLFISLFSLTCFSFQTEAQILKKLGDKIGRSLEKSSEAEADADASTIRKRLPADFELDLTGSGPDMYMEYKVIMEGEGLEDNQMGMSMKMFTSPSQRAGRAETIMTMPMIGEIRMVTLTDFDNPLQMIMLNERKKEYSVIDLNDINKRDDGEEYTVTRLGEENLHGMHCVRSKAETEEHTSEIQSLMRIPYAVLCLKKKKT